MGFFDSLEDIGKGILTGGLFGAPLGPAGITTGALLFGGKAAVDDLTDPNNAPKPQVKLTSQNPIASQATASTTALQAILAKEQNARSSGSVLTSPSGLHDEPTTTASLLTGV